MLSAWALERCHGLYDASTETWLAFVAPWKDAVGTIFC